jgi:hypothetical protein
VCFARGSLSRDGWQQDCFPTLNMPPNTDGDTPASARAKHFADLAEAERARAIAALPVELTRRKAYWVEIARSLDYESLLAATAGRQRLVSTDFTILNWGWNSATAQLLQAPPEDARPAREVSAPEAGLQPRNTLHRLGCSVLLRRAAEMLAKGIATARETDNGNLVFRATETTAAYYLDRVDQRRLTALIRGVRAADPGARSDKWTYGWTEDRKR